MADDRIKHGGTVTFRATFVDVDGDPASPDAAVHLRYVSIGSRTVAREAVELIEVDGLFTAKWDTSVAEPSKPVFWNVRAGEDDDFTSEFGTFTFDHNAAGLPDPV